MKPIFLGKKIKMRGFEKSGSKTYLEYGTIFQKNRMKKLFQFVFTYDFIL